jgi:DNA mismatch repair protein MutL
MQHLLTYIIYSDGNDLVIMDQHAAHERIMYEKLKNGQISGIQGLLVPKSIELEPSAFNKLEGSINAINKLGFDIEIFGKNTVVVRSVPAVLRHNEIDRSLEEILSELGDALKAKSVDEREDAIAKTLACRSAVKAGDKLSAAEMNGIVNELKTTSNPSTCPHGRPTMIRMSLADLERSFKRK